MTKKLKYFIPAILIALVLIGASCDKDDDKKSDRKEKPDIYASYEEYEKTDWGFDIKYPNDWKKEILSDTAEGFVVGFLSPEESDDDMFAQNIIVFTSLPQPQDFEEAMKYGLEEMSANPSIKVHSYKKVMVSESPAYVIEYSAVDIVTDFKYLHYFIDGGEFWYQILYTADREGYEVFVDEAQKIIDSFTIK